jgi:hypothetical protein
LRVLKLWAFTPPFFAFAFDMNCLYWDRLRLPFGASLSPLSISKRHPSQAVPEHAPWMSEELQGLLRSNNLWYLYIFMLFLLVNTNVDNITNIRDYGIYILTKVSAHFIHPTNHHQIIIKSSTPNHNNNNIYFKYYYYYYLYFFFFILLSSPLSTLLSSLLIIITQISTSSSI